MPLILVHEINWTHWRINIHIHKYYRYINELANEKLGGSETVMIIMYSVNFGEIKVLTKAQDWEKIAGIICKVAQTNEQVGASCLLIGANTMHKIAAMKTING